MMKTQIFAFNSWTSFCLFIFSAAEYFQINACLLIRIRSETFWVLTDSPWEDWRFMDYDNSWLTLVWLGMSSGGFILLSESYFNASWFWAATDHLLPAKYLLWPPATPSNFPIMFALIELFWIPKGSHFELPSDAKLLFSYPVRYFKGWAEGCCLRWLS